MNTLIKRTAHAAATVALTAATAFAAPETTESTGLLGWAFMGFLAVIIVAQAMPALMMIVGAALGLRKEGRAAKVRH